MKNEKGITILMLVVTVVVLLLLATATINFGTNSLQAAKFQNFIYEMQQIQGRVDAIYEKIKGGNESNIMLGRNITESQDAMNTLNKVKGIDYSNISEDEKETYYYQSSTYYRYLSDKDLEEYLNVTSSIEAVIINFMTREVISVYGFEYEGKVYYRLSDI